MYLCAPAYTCICTCTDIHTYVCIYIHTYVYTYTLMYIHTHVHMYLRTCIDIHTSQVYVCPPFVIRQFAQSFHITIFLMYVRTYVRMCHLRATNLCVRWCEQHCSKETETDLEAHERLQGHGCRGDYSEYESLHRGCEMWSIYVCTYVVCKQVCSVWWLANVDSFHSTTKLVGVMMKVLLQYNDGGTVHAFIWLCYVGSFFSVL